MPGKLNSDFLQVMQTSLLPHLETTLFPHRPRPTISKPDFKLVTNTKISFLYPLKASTGIGKQMARSNPITPYPTIQLF